MSVKISPRVLRGPWASGIALDLHTTSSTFLGNDSLGHPQFDTVRSPIGELIYRLKYKQDATAIAPIVEATVEFLGRWKPSVDAIVTAPPSNSGRRKQPVLELAERLSQQTGLPICDTCIRKVKATGQMKDFEEWKRTEVLTGAFAVDGEKIARRRLLLFDDLYDSGATAQAITRVLLDPGGCSGRIPANLDSDALRRYGQCFYWWFEGRFAAQ
jgi:competence protein ComFC